MNNRHTLKSNVGIGLNFQKKINNEKCITVLVMCIFISELWQLGLLRR